MMRPGRIAAVLAGLAAGMAAMLVAVPAWFGAANAHEPELSRYGYWRDIRPLLERRCASCHSGTAPHRST